MFWLEFTIIAARTLIEIIFFAIGATIFSFLNVVIYRLPRHKGYVKGKSMCTTCGHTLYRKDLVPIISWVKLKGRCRYCGAKILVRYTIVEMLGGAAAVAATLILGISLWALLAFLLAGVFTVVVCIAYDTAKAKHN